MSESRLPAWPVSLKDLPQWVEVAEGYAPVVESLRAGHAATIDGGWHSASSLVAASLALNAPKTLVVVLAHPRDLDSWAADIASFAGIPSHLFPAWDSIPDQNTVLDEIGGQRLRLLRQLDADTPPRIVLTTMQALLQPVPNREQLSARRRRLKVGQEVRPEDLVAWLVEKNYERMEAVELPGEFSRRGGILDAYSSDAEAPYRIEFLGDEIESIRQFSPESQRSLGDLQAVDLTAHGQAIVGDEGFRGNFCDWLPPGSWTMLVELSELQEQAKFYLERVPDITGLFSIPSVFQKLTSYPSVRMSSIPTTSMETTCHLKVESVERFSGDVTKVKDELDTAAARDFVLVACHNDAERQRLQEVLGDSLLAKSGRLRLAVGQVHAGFRLVLGGGLPPPPLGGEGSKTPTSSSPRGEGGQTAIAGLVVLGDHELFRRDQAHGVLPRRRIESRAIDSFLDLQEDDLVVHLSHGIARFRGMHLLEKNGQSEEHLILEFAAGTKVYVPASKVDLVQKYVGGAKADPELSKLGGTSWAKKKERVEQAVMDLASEMVELQAVREAQPGEASPPDSDWQRDFEAAFPYQETPDQLAGMIEIKRDMERPRSMDRLVCGDVGYGKTELAIRAAFKAIDNGKQVAVLVPTTVLAEQHFRTFSARLADYPFTVDSLSRFRSHGEQRAVIKKLEDGALDVVIGTHRLVSNDVKFKELGLVIIDEEQRFGVEHKEKLKKLRATVDVLTLSATPIPRTLHLSLLGIRDISNLETPPQGRLAIETRIVRWDESLIRNAIHRELNREGQIYFVHNRVHDIHAVANKIRGIVPEARIVIGHGQMTPEELESAMVKFVRREADILVATTIIESGLDIPNANTIFIHQADNYGLADLHQLRGRVGRYKHRAYAYMILNSEKPLAPNAARRLKAIEEFHELGAGFKIAMKDLEIRGAGNILGTQQSGHIASVGYELYCQLLESAVRTLKNMPARRTVETHLDLPLSAYLPRDYVPGQKLRIEVYRRLGRIRKLDRLDDFRNELRDRYGAWTEPVEWLLRLAELRILAERWQIPSVHLEGKTLEDLAGPVDIVLTYQSVKKIETLAKRSGGRLRIVDKESAYFRLRPPERNAMGLYRVLQELLKEMPKAPAASTSLAGEPERQRG
ncbi:MAG: transcription-repair coupling factor [Gemmataceae bacterium]|nr:transcription-repair coupling factor [Gemmataceae bacterium]